MNAHEAQGILGMFLANYPQSSADEMTIALWARSLENIPFEDGKQAAYDWMSTSPYWPTVADINGLLSGYRRRRNLTESGRPQIGEGHIPSYADGCQIARRAYVAECRSQGREPTPSKLAMFDSGDWLKDTAS